MSSAASVLPAGPGERDVDVFPLRERLRFRDKFGLALMELRARGKPFQALQKGPWALFIAIAVHWQSNAEAWPSQEALARFSGWSSRAVRDQAYTLERGGFIRLRRERRANGSERIFYAPGLVTLAELAAFVDRYPRERPKGAEPPEEAAPAVPISNPPPEAVSGAPPEGPSMELSELNLIEPSSCQTDAPPSADRAEEQAPIDLTEEDREVAKAALVERMHRKHPTRPPPRWFDASELALVAACSGALEGDREAKLEAHRDALEGAHLASKDGPPTVRFIWGKLEHFLDHVERGRKKARALRLRDAPVAPPPPAAETQPGVTSAQVRADIERLFGPLEQRGTS